MMWASSFKWYSKGMARRDLSGSLLWHCEERNADPENLPVFDTGSLKLLLASVRDCLDCFERRAVLTPIRLSSRNESYQASDRMFDPSPLCPCSDVTEA